MEIDTRFTGVSPQPSVDFSPKSRQADTVGQDTKTLKVAGKGPKYEQDVFMNESTIQKSVGKVNQFLQGSNRELRYTIHEKTNTYYVKVVDTITDEVVREIPSERSLEFLASMMELAGILVDTKG